MTCLSFTLVLCKKLVLSRTVSFKFSLCSIQGAGCPFATLTIADATGIKDDDGDPVAAPGVGVFLNMTARSGDA